MKLQNAANSLGAGKSYESSGCTGVLQLNALQKVWIRKNGPNGNFLHERWSSFFRLAEFSNMHQVFAPKHLQAVECYSLE